MAGGGKIEQEKAQAIIAELLKSQRENIGLSQKDVANALGYKNFNFISMIERSISNIPFSKIVDIVNAYRFDMEMALVITKFLHPDCWELSKNLLRIYLEKIDGNEAYSDKKTDKSVDQYLAKIAKKLHVNTNNLLRTV